MTNGCALTYPPNHMAERTRFWRSNRWRDALRPDTDMAQAEGLAAGTGLLTGTVAKTAGARTATTVRSHLPVVPGRRRDHGRRPGRPGHHPALHLVRPPVDLVHLSAHHVQRPAANR